MNVSRGIRQYGIAVLYSGACGSPHQPQKMRGTPKKYFDGGLQLSGGCGSVFLDSVSFWRGSLGDSLYLFALYVSGNYGSGL